ncbi:hypothetical protein AUJ14_03870 [Candidatus Micrarchaeota archaeon CG1_02_55_22]|nr:MAG: hypothetical protein AUJ14_03870 [Candidatus Micrarchaeota archaeon CG1_02_55_22]
MKTIFPETKHGSLLRLAPLAAITLIILLGLYAFTTFNTRTPPAVDLYYEYPNELPSIMAQGSAYPITFTIASFEDSALDGEISFDCGNTTLVLPVHLDSRQTETTTLVAEPSPVTRPLSTFSEEWREHYDLPPEAILLMPNYSVSGAFAVSYNSSAANLSQTINIDYSRKINSSGNLSYLRGSITIVPEAGGFTAYVTRNNSVRSREYQDCTVGVDFGDSKRQITFVYAVESSDD